MEMKKIKMSNSFEPIDFANLLNTHQGWEEICDILARELEKSNHNVAAITKILIKMPCIYAKKYLSEPEDQNFVCELCNLKNVIESINFTSHFVNKIEQLVLALLNNPSRTIKFQLVDLLKNAFNHSKKVDLGLLQPFLQYEKDTNDLACKENLYKLLAQILRESKPIADDSYMPMTADRLFIVRHVLNSFDSMVLKVLEKPNALLLENSQNTDDVRPARAQQISSILRFMISSALPFAMGVDDEMAVGLFRLIFKSISLMKDNMHLILLCQELVKTMAESSSVESWEFLCRYKEEIAEDIVSHLLYKMSNDFDPKKPSHTQPLLLFLSTIELIGGFSKSPLSFQTHYFPHIVSYILPKLHVEKKSVHLLSILSRVSGESLKDMLNKYFTSYSTRIVLFETPSVVRKVFNFLISKEQLKLDFIGKYYLQDWFNEIISFLHHKHRVLIIIEQLVLWTSGIPLKKLVNSDARKQLNVNARDDFISKRLMGFFMYVDTVIKSRITSVESKRRILVSLIDLITLMGQTRMMPRRNKLFSILSTFTHLSPVYHDLILRAWKTIFGTLDEEGKLEMTVPAIYALMPLREKMTLEVDEAIFAFLNQTRFKNDHLFRLPFLADLQDSHGTSLRTAKAVKKENSENMCTFINILIHETSHTSSCIKLLMLKKLKELLHNANYCFHQKLDKDPLFHSTVLELIVYLLDISNGDEETLIISSSECLGLIGAIDPKRFEYIHRVEKRANMTTFTLSSAEFKLSYLNLLVKGFKDSFETPNFNMYGYTIQNLVRIFKINCTATDPICATLPGDYRKLIEPLTQTTYSLRSQPNPDYPTPIFNSPTYGDNFTTWISSWVLKLATFLRDGSPKMIFETSRILIKKNETIATFLLPHVITYAILGGSDDQIRTIETEINTIFDFWSTDEKGFVQKTFYTLNNWIGETADETSNRSYQLHASRVIFKLLEHLQMSVNISKYELSLRNPNVLFSTMSGPNSKHLEAEDILKIENFLQRISNRKASIVALHCEDYSRSVQFIEQYLDFEPDEFQNHISYIQNLYISLDDLDSADGASALRTCSNSLHELLEYTTKGKLEESISTFERVLRDHNELATYQTIAEIYLLIDQPNMANTIIEGCLLTKPSWSQKFIDTRIELAWRNLRFPEMRKVLKEAEQVKVCSWMVHIGQIISNIYLNQTECSLLEITRARVFITSHLVASFSGIESYLRSIDYVSKLQILSEATDVINLLVSLNHDSSINREDEILKNLNIILKRWNDRQKVIPSTLEFVDPILQARKVNLSMLKLHLDKFSFSKTLPLINEAIRDMGVFIAKKELKRGNFGRARFCLEKWKSNSDSFNIDLYNVKVFVQMGMKEKGLNLISELVDKNSQTFEFYRQNHDHDNSSIETRKNLGQALRLYAKLNEEFKTMDYEENLKCYLETIKVDPSEKNFLVLASYYDRYHKEGDYMAQQNVVKYYCESLIHGVQFIHQSLFRSLTIWFDFGAKISTDPNPDPIINKKQNSILDEMSRMIHCTSLKVPARDFYVAISQLNSRICHENVTVWNVLRQMIKTIVETYPKQTLWWLLASYESNNKTRKNRCQQIFNEFSANPTISFIIREYKYIGQELCKIAEARTKDRVPTTSVETLNKNFWRILQTHNLNNILLPIGRNLDRPLPKTKYEILMSNLVNEVQVMTSIQKPKKLTFIGTDGKTYGILCKPNDDLRKDYRTMEVNNVINIYLSKYEDSRTRQLRIRTYSVVPLTESTGICEWVSNLKGLREIINSFYKQNGIKVKTTELTEIFHEYDTTLSLDERQVKFTTEILPAYPPFLHKWFSLNFPDPQTWFAARLAFIRTSAVMSIVGYVLGLGDRHGVNVLIDTESGDAVHVDFNCLFNRGETAYYPERVPFRLTHNMIKAMGPLGYDGGFRRSCELTFAVIQKQKDILMSVLRPFIFDPFLDQNSKNKIQAGEHCSLIALEYMRRIESRIDGSGRNFTKKVDIALSKEALVGYLIKEATSAENLCQMYVGWAAYM